MRHNVGYRKLGRVTEHRMALLRNQAIALLRHEAEAKFDARCVEALSRVLERRFEPSGLIAV